MNLHPNNARTSIVNGAVVCAPRRKNVAIVGFGPTSILVRQLQDNPDWEIWGINDGYKNPCFYDGELLYVNSPGFRGIDLDGQTARLRVDRWFEMHPMRVQPVDDVAWLARCPVPVYLLRDIDRAASATARNYPKSPAYAPESLPDIPNAVTYPLEAVRRAIPIPDLYFASTFAYQIALALVEGFEGIGFFGLDFGSEREIVFERGNAMWWAGLAAGHRRTMAPKGSTFLSHGALYGYEYDEEVDWCNTWAGRYRDWWGLEKKP